MALTQEDATLLAQPFKADDHGVRVGSSKDNLWLAYVEEEPLIMRLNEIDPAWTMDITRISHESVAADGTGGYVACYGTLTIKGVTRAGVGTQEADSYYNKQQGKRIAKPLGENDEKGAATDMLKRCARLFGVGLYLKGLDKIIAKNGADALSELRKMLGESPGKPQQRSSGSNKPPRQPDAPTPPSATTGAQSASEGESAWWDVDEVKVTTNGARSVISIQNGKEIANVWTRQPFRNGGYDVSDWTEPGTYPLPKTAHVEVVRVENWWRIQTVEPVSERKAG